MQRSQGRFRRLFFSPGRALHQDNGCHSTLIGFSIPLRLKRQGEGKFGGEKDLAQYRTDASGELRLVRA
jgi:hypothetical protein